MIEVKNLHKSFGKDGELQVLKGIDYTIEKGERIVLIGPSGSGKSTFLRCLNLLEVPTEGEVYFDGELITSPKCNINLVRQKMGMVFQHFNLFPHKTILENITLAPVKLKLKTREEAEKKARELLEMVGLPEKADEYPSRLSGGQKQRVAIAGLMAMLPECMIFDEATAMLDPQGRKEVMDTILKLNKEKGITVLHITHNMDEAALADRVVVIDDGRVLLDGKPGEVFSKVQLMQSVGLDVLQCTELLHELAGCGLPLPDDVTDAEQCARVIYEYYLKTQKKKDEK